MISERLKERVLYQRRARGNYDPEAEAIIDVAVRKLVLVMRGLEEGGIMDRESIEDCVVSAFEQAEFLYYGLSQRELMAIMDFEIGNAKGRKKMQNQMPDEFEEAEL